MRLVSMRPSSSFPRMTRGVKRVLAEIDMVTELVESVIAAAKSVAGELASQAALAKRRLARITSWSGGSRVAGAQFPRDT